MLRTLREVRRAHVTEQDRERPLRVDLEDEAHRRAAAGARGVLDALDPTGPAAELVAVVGEWLHLVGRLPHIDTEIAELEVVRDVRNRVPSEDAVRRQWDSRGRDRAAPRGGDQALRVHRREGFVGRGIVIAGVVVPAGPAGEDLDQAVAASDAGRQPAML